MHKAIEKIAHQIEDELVGKDDSKFGRFQKMVKHRFRLMEKHDPQSPTNLSNNNSSESRKHRSRRNPWPFLPLLFSGENRVLVGSRRIDRQKDLSACYVLLAICRDFVLLKDYEIPPIINRDITKLYPRFDLEECGKLFFSDDRSVNLVKQLKLALKWVKADLHDVAESRRAAEAELAAEAKRTEKAKLEAEAGLAAEAERETEAELATKGELEAEAERTAKARRMADAKRAAEVKMTAEAKMAEQAELNKKADLQAAADFAATASNEQKPAGSNQTRKPGRPIDTDRKEDKGIFDLWKTGQYNTHADLGRELGISKRKVFLAIDRHRKRLERAAHE